MRTTTTPDLRTVDEAAAMVSLAPKTIWKYLTQGRLERFKRGRLGVNTHGPEPNTTYVDLNQLLALLAPSQEEPAAGP